MKQFLWRLAAFALAAAVLFAGVLGLSAVKPFSGILAKLTASTGYDASVAEEMGAHIDSVRTPDGADALILGTASAIRSWTPSGCATTNTASRPATGP